MSQEPTFRMASVSDLPELQNIRSKAFAPVFDSFRNILGDEIYTLAQAREDSQQGEMLSSLFLLESNWQVFAVELAEEVIGFVSIKLDYETKVGEIGLNAILPEHSGNGIGTAMYQFAVLKMQESGMRVATVATGGDISHAPARRAYEKAGFDVQIPSVWMCRTL